MTATRIAADRIAALEAENARLRNQLGNAEGAIVDTGNHHCLGPHDVAAAIYRLTADRDQHRDTLAALEAEVARLLAMRSRTPATPRERWGTCCPHDPHCEHSHLDLVVLLRWLDAAISDEHAAKIETVTW